MNLNQVTLPVTDMPAAVAFYQQLGFLLIVDTPHYTRFACPEGNSTFSLHLSEPPLHSRTTIYFEHEQLDEWVNELKDRGIVFTQDPVDQSYLWREAVLEDPSGNPIKLYWAGENRLNPPWRVN